MAQESNKSGNFNQHMIYAKTGVATPSQIEAALKFMHKELEKIAGRPLPSDIEINVINGRGGKPVGFTYIWVSNTELFNAMIGRNFDGSERKGSVPDPEFLQALPKEAYLPYDQWMEVFGDRLYPVADPARPDVYLPNGTWLSDLEEEQGPDWSVFMNDPESAPMISGYLNPLVPTPTYSMSPEQERDYVELTQRDPNPDHFAGPGRIWLTRSTYRRPAPGLSTSVLKASRVPNWLTPADIKAKFAKFVTDPSFKYGHRVNGQLVQESYPVVSFDKFNQVYVKFNPQSTDAGFASEMRKFVEFSKNGQKAILRFEFAPEVAPRN